MPDLGLAQGGWQVASTAPPGSTPDSNPTTPAGQGPAGNSAGPNPYNTPIPGVAQYSQLIALAQKAYKQAVAEFGLQRSQLLQQYGYTGQIDPATGLVKNLGVDPNNPYGLYQQTLHGYGQAAEGLKEQMASRGIRGGLANQAMDQQKYGFGKDTSTLAQQLQQSLLGVQEQQTQAYFQEQTSIVNAQLSALQQAIAMMLSGQTIDPANLSGITAQLPKPS